MMHSYDFSNTYGWSAKQIQEKIGEVKQRLDWSNTTGSARKWWEAFEAENRERLSLVLRLTEELNARETTITEFFLAYVYSNIDNIGGNLHYLDYTRLKRQAERRNKVKLLNDTSAAVESNHPNRTESDRWFHWSASTNSTEFTNTNGWNEGHLPGRLQQVRNQLDWENTDGDAKKWWEQLEEESKPFVQYLLGLAEELSNRKATITEFFLAFVNSNTDNIQSNLHFLDYLRSKEEERKKKASVLQK
jgi:hypothetical protein